MYRHFASCLNSLKRRQAGSLLVRPSSDSKSTRFWTEPQTALESWLVHNRAILNCLKDNPDRCVLVSQEAQIAGFNLPSFVASQFPVDLSIDSDTGIDERKIYREKILTLDALPVRQALEETWDELQSLSKATANNYPTVVWGKSEHDTSEEALAEALTKLKVSWNKLGVPAENQA